VDVLRVGWTASSAGRFYPFLRQGLSLTFPYSTAGAGSYAAEITTPFNIVVTPDFIPGVFARVGPLLRIDGGWQIALHGPAVANFTLQRSVDLKHWDDLASDVFDFQGMVILNLPLDPAVSFFRASRTQ
jgi:hypothetical protein